MLGIQCEKIRIQIVIWCFVEKLLYIFIIIVQKQMFLQQRADSVQITMTIIVQR